MELHTLAIPIAFILLAAVLCLLLIGSKWKWWQKLALIVIVPSFGLAVWASIASYKGWPTRDALPTKSVVYWTIVREPNPARNDPGAIFLWATSLDAVGRTRNPLTYASPGDEPRAYRLPYSRELHLGLQNAQGSMREGRPVVLDLTGREGTRGAGERGDRTQERPNSDGRDAGTPTQGPRARDEDGIHDFMIYGLPPPHPPSKE